ncbi:CDK5 regulatory subunit-associated protein 3 [Pyrgilauda ruficollis]|uniref:CDK5 regulatory subunit-associated protein 3 n=1 Tax=Pyrgilauda ruficollis TaxID=221976 RepID=UPI001B866FED|nr:CDK5 regulatory subunit-associated protein 3 [Pyrgilauda ruficollis]
MQVAPQDYRNVPIDIQTSKLLDWLLDRRHCGRRWPAQVAQVRERIRAALQDMPEHPEIRALLQGSCQCLAPAAGSGIRAWLGGFGNWGLGSGPGFVATPDPAGRAPGGVGVTVPSPPAELSSLLARSIGYELPALRRQRGRWQQAQQELARREDECQLRAGELRERFLSSCRQYGIAGQDVRRELLAQVQALPSLLSRIGDGASALGDAIELYQACVAFVCDSPGAEALPLLRLAVSHGNCSVFRWRTGREPQRLERPEPREAPEPPREDTIDWGDFPAEPPQGGDIDWGITVEPGPQGDDGIDWGDGEKGQEGTITAEPSPQGDDGIDWGDGEKGQEGTITVVESGTEAPAAPEDVARGSDALTLLENPETRNQFIDELMEVGTGDTAGPGCDPGSVPVSVSVGVPVIVPGGVPVPVSSLSLSRSPSCPYIEADISKRYGGRPVNLMGVNL